MSETRLDGCGRAVKVASVWAAGVSPITDAATDGLRLLGSGLTAWLLRLRPGSLFVGSAFLRFFVPLPLLLLRADVVVGVDCSDEAWEM